MNIQILTNLACPAMQLAANYGIAHYPQVSKDVHLITYLFIAVNSALLTWNTLSPNNSLSKAANWGAFGASALGGAFYYGLAGGNSEPKVVAQINYGEDASSPIHQKEDVPSSQRLYQAIVVALLIQTTFRICVNKEKAFLALQLAGLVGTLLKSRSLNWVELSTKVHVTLQYVYYQLGYPHSTSTLRDPEVSYHALLVKPLFQDSDLTYSCSNEHEVRQNTLIDSFCKKIEKLAKDVLIYRNNYTATFHFEKGKYDIHYRHTHTTYTLTIREGDLPSCHDCDEVASHAFLSFKQGSLKIEDEGHNAKSSFWASCYTLLSAVQLTMAIVQYKYPHLAPSIYKAQKLMLALDLPAIIELISTETKMFQVDTGKDHALVIGFVASIAIGVFIAYDQWKTAPKSYNHHISESLSSHQLNAVTIDSSAPTIHRILQWAFISRFFLCAGLAESTENKNLLRVAAIVNALTALRLTQMAWVRIQRNFSFEPGVHRAVKADLYFMIPNPEEWLPNDAAVQGAVQKLYDYSTEFFSGSDWDVYWLITTRHGHEVSRRLVYDVTIIPKLDTLNNIKIFDLLQSWNGAGALNLIEGKIPAS